MAARYNIAISYIADNCVSVSVGKLTVYFSYMLPVAFRVKGKGLTVCQNAWGDETEKHLEFIELGKKMDFKERTEKDKFRQVLLAASDKNFIECAGDILKDKFGINIKEDAMEANINQEAKTGKGS